MMAASTPMSCSNVALQVCVPQSARGIRMVRVPLGRAVADLGPLLTLTMLRPSPQS